MMKIYIYKIALLYLISILLVGCNLDFDSPLENSELDPITAYSGHPLIADPGDWDSSRPQIYGAEDDFYWEDSVSIAYGKVDGMDFKVRKTISAPEKAILEIRIPDAEPRIRRCHSPDSTFLVHIKLTNPLNPGYTVAAFLPPNSHFDSVKVNVPAPDSIVLVLHAPHSSVLGGNNTNGFQVKIYISDGSGNSLPEVDNLIESMVATCGGIEVVIMPELCMGPVVEFRQPIDLFRTFDQIWDEQPMGENKIWKTISALWQNERLLHPFSAHQTFSMDILTDGR